MIILINNIVDWASLAQQWIKMKETTPAMPSGQQGRPKPEPTLLGPSQLKIDTQTPPNMITPIKAFSDHTVASPIAG